METELVGEVVKRAIVLRGGEVLSGFAEDASKALGQIGPSAPSFSVGATAVIALTSFACGGVAGWALKELFGEKK
jgi:hypothetical protein